MSNRKVIFHYWLPVIWTLVAIATIVYRPLWVVPWFQTSQPFISIDMDYGKLLLAEVDRELKLVPKMNLILEQSLAEHQGHSFQPLAYVEFDLYQSWGFTVFRPWVKYVDQSHFSIDPLVDELALPPKEEIVSLTLLTAKNHLDPDLPTSYPFRAAQRLGLLDLIRDNRAKINYIQFKNIAIDASIIAYYASACLSLLWLLRDAFFYNTKGLPGSCNNCGYSLVGLQCDRCPECGGERKRG